MPPLLPCWRTLQGGTKQTCSHLLLMVGCLASCKVQYRLTKSINSYEDELTKAKGQARDLGGALYLAGGRPQLQLVQAGNLLLHAKGCHSADTADGF